MAATRPLMQSMKEPSENSEEGSTNNIVRTAASVVLPPISTNAIRSLRASLDGKLVSSNFITSSDPSNVNLTNMLQSMILRSGHNSQASSQVASRRSSNNFDAKASSAIVSGMGSRIPSSIFDENEEVLHPTLMAMSNSAADLSSLSALQGILDAALAGDSEGLVSRTIAFLLHTIDPTLPF